jgi:hypothetical protein
MAETEAERDAVYANHRRTWAKPRSMNSPLEPASRTATWCQAR